MPYGCLQISYFIDFNRNYIVRLPSLPFLTELLFFSVDTVSLNCVPPIVCETNLTKLRSWRITKNTEMHSVHCDANFSFLRKRNKTSRLKPDTLCAYVLIQNLITLN